MHQQRRSAINAQVPHLQEEKLETIEAPKPPKVLQRAKAKRITNTLSCSSDSNASIRSTGQRGVANCRERDEHRAAGIHSK